MWRMRLEIFWSLVVTAGVVLFRSGIQADQLCLTGDFESQLQYILRSQMLTTQDIANISRLLDDVLPTLSKRWQGYEVYPFGSVTIGIGLKTSDLDYYIRLQNEYSLDMLYVLEETDKLFKEQPSLYSRVSFKYIKFPLFQFFHIPTQRNVDIIYKFGDGGLRRSQLIRYFFNLDERFLPLGGILKIWSEIHGLTGASRTLPNYALYMLILFYLQQKNMVPSVYVLQRDSVSYFVDNWDVGFNEIPYNSTNTENVYQLLRGFFEYYNEFNFEEYMVSPFAGHPINKSAFVDIQNFPKEFSSYKYSLKHTLQLRILNDLNINTDMCIQDTVQHDLNTGEKVSHEDFKKFKSLMKSVVRLFDELPIDKFLRGFLVVDQYNETDTYQNNATEDGIGKREDCIEVSLT